MGQDWGDPQVPPQWQQRPQEPQWPGQYGQQEQPQWQDGPYARGRSSLPGVRRRRCARTGSSSTPSRHPPDYAPGYQQQPSSGYWPEQQQPSGYWPQPQYAEPSQQAYPQPSYSQHQPQRRAPRRRGAAWAMWDIGAVVLLAGSAGATVALRHHAAAAAKPLTCKQQYAAWKTGPVPPESKKLLVSDAKTLHAKKARTTTSPSINGRPQGNRQGRRHAGGVPDAGRAPTRRATGRRTSPT